MFTCSNKGCDNLYEQKTHNQKYCSDECCRQATNSRIMEKYYEDKDRRSGKPRTCETEGCGTKLSRYNELLVCQKCASRVDSDNRRRLFSIIGIEYESD